MAKKENSLFALEEAALRRAWMVLEEAGKSTAAPADDFARLLAGKLVSVDEFARLTEDYRRMLKQLRLLVKTGDKQQKRLNALNEKLELRNNFIKQTFGRYLSDDIAEHVLESPEGATLGGEKREVTILMSDLRGFTTVTERLPAESIVKMLNIYLGVMTEVIYKYGGTIDEFIGDGILAIFGAPMPQQNHAGQAVACAMEMQLAMKKVNRKFKRIGLPQVKMGIGINTGELVAGNIGSQKRVKYGVVGHHVNLTSRIESYTSGGQTFISQSTKDKCGSILQIKDSMEVEPKGVDNPITIYEITGITGPYNLEIPRTRKPSLKPLKSPVKVMFAFVTEKHVESTQHKGLLVKYGGGRAEILSDRRMRKFSELKVQLLHETLATLPSGSPFILYGKVLGNLVVSGSYSGFQIQFAALSPDVEHIFSD